MEWVSDSDDSVDYSCFDNDEKKPEPPVIAFASTSNRVRNDGASSSSSSLMAQYLAMGFPADLIVRAIKENGEGDSDKVVDLILTYMALDEEKPENGNANGNGYENVNVNVKREYEEEEEDRDWSNNEYDDDFDDWDFEMEMSGLARPESKYRTLVELGFTEDQAAFAIDKCGDEPIDELVDFITAAETQNVDFEDEKRTQNLQRYDPFRNGCNKRFKNGKEPLKRASRPSKSHHEPGDLSEALLALHLPNPMVGFGLPENPNRVENRYLPEKVKGPPYFFYENVALAPKGVWTTISNNLYEVEPEFVDSKYFSAAARKRGYIHNLPIVNRFPVLPLPPKTIQEAFPRARRWWPAWDKRTQFNCLQTCIGSAKLTERLHQQMVSSADPSDPPKYVKDEVNHQCRKWNLMWVGQNRLAVLECDEVEFLLGFPPNHTRTGSATRTERYKSLGNSFQVDTVAYLLSPLRELFPNGMNVLSLFTGIGGAEVALHRLGIKMNFVLSVEKESVNRSILRGWWDETGQTGKLVEMDDVQKVTEGHLRRYAEKYGKFDFVIGGSPCNNLAGSNRHHRDGLEGEHSSLFFDYVRILDIVRGMAGRY